MKLITLILGFAVSMTVTSIAMADQCAGVTKSQAEKALKAVLETSELQTLCEPCGETEPKTVVVKSVGIRKATSGGYWELIVNNAGVDLAYTYANSLNLAKFAGCAASGVSLALP